MLGRAKRYLRKLIRDQVEVSIVIALLLSLLALTSVIYWLLEEVV